MTKITCEPFGVTASGEEATRYILDNGTMKVCVLDYGCTIQSVIVPDRNGNPTDIVLGYDTIGGYENGRRFFGALVGRYANRIKNAEFTLNGKRYTLAHNDGAHHLHGVLSKRIFAGDIDGDTLVLTRACPAEEEGFPGVLNLEVRYTLGDDNALSIGYRAISDEDTPINLTNHSYFNLNGHGVSSVLDQYLRMDCASFTENDSESVPTGKILSVEDSPMDFRVEKAIGVDIDSDYPALKTAHGYDHNFIISGYTGELRSFAAARSERTGIVLTAFTTQPAVQLFTPDYATVEDAGIGKGDVSYLGRCAFCLETQHYPSSVGYPQFPSTILKRGEVYRETTVYRFSVE